MPERILGESLTTVSTAKRWARGRGSTATFQSLAGWYWRLAPERGVRPEVAYAQSSIETGWGRFGGIIDGSYKNPAGMKTRQGGSNTDPDAHAKFPTWACGIAAQLDHLALYAGAPGYPRHGSPDGRHFAVLLGVGPTIETAGLKWATDPDYVAAWLARVASLVKSV
jgi:N-acetylmuramoyl-L-alanine amidase